MNDPERAALDLLASLRLSTDERPDVLEVAARMRVPIAFVPKAPGWSALGDFRVVDGAEQVRIRAGLTARFRACAIAHELGHVIVHRSRLRLDDEERWCNRFGSALLAPQPFVRRVWDQHRDVPVLLERHADIPPTALVMRLGEVGVADVWVAQGARVLYRRASAPPPPAWGELAAVALQDKTVVRARGLVVGRLPEQPRRVFIASTG